MFRMKSCLWSSPKCFGIPKVKLDFLIMDWEFRSLGHKKKQMLWHFYILSKKYWKVQSTNFFLWVWICWNHLKVLITPSILTSSIPQGTFTACAISFAVYVLVFFATATTSDRNLLYRDCFFMITYVFITCFHKSWIGFFVKNCIFHEKWYFVTIIVLTYCEKKLF